MKAKDLTQADVGKWVALRGEVSRFDDSETYHPVEIIIPNGGSLWIDRDTTLEFTDPPAPVQEVGDVFSHSMQKDEEWTLAAIALDGKACLLTYKNQHQSSFYPLHQGWTLVRKGTAS